MKASGKRIDFTTKNKGYRTITIQKACRVGEESFNSYALYDSDNGNTIRTFRLTNFNEMSGLQPVTAFGTLFTLVGLICQFVGLMSLHALNSLILLAADLFMIGLRAGACQGLARHLTNDPLYEGHELAYVTLVWVMKIEGWQLNCGNISSFGNSGQARPTRPNYSIPKISHQNEESDKGDEPRQICTTAINTRVRMQSLVGSHPQVSEDEATWPAPFPLEVLWTDDNAILATQLNTAICSVYKLIAGNQDLNIKPGLVRPADSPQRFWWDNEILLQKGKDPKTAQLIRGGFELSISGETLDTISASQEVLSAVLSLTQYTIKNHRKRRPMDTKSKYRLLGGYSDQKEFDKRKEHIIQFWLEGAAIILFSLGHDGITMTIKSEEVPDPSISLYPVFGLNLPSIKEAIEQNRRTCSPDASADRDSPSSSKPCPERDSLQRACWLFGVMTNTPVQKLIAQEVFSNFLAALAGQTISERPIPPEEHEARQIRGPWVNRRTEGTWHAQFFGSIAQELLISGLVDTTTEANYIIYPAFEHLLRQRSITYGLEMRKLAGTLYQV